MYIFAPLMLGKSDIFMWYDRKKLKISRNFKCIEKIHSENRAALMLLRIKPVEKSCLMSFN